MKEGAGRKKHNLRYSQAVREQEAALKRGPFSFLEPKTSLKMDSASGNQHRMPRHANSDSLWAVLSSIDTCALLALVIVFTLASSSLLFALTAGIQLPFPTASGSPRSHVQQRPSKFGIFRKEGTRQTDKARVQTSQLVKQESSLTVAELPNQCAWNQQVVGGGAEPRSRHPQTHIRSTIFCISGPKEGHERSPMAQCVYVCCMIFVSFNFPSHHLHPPPYARGTWSQREGT